MFNIDVEYKKKKSEIVVIQIWLVYNLIWIYNCDVICKLGSYGTSIPTVKYIHVCGDQPLLWDDLLIELFIGCNCKEGKSGLCSFGCTCNR